MLGSHLPALPRQPGDSRCSFILSLLAVCSGHSETHSLTRSFAHQLFVDKDTIVNAVGTSHDIHLLKIDNREDELLTRVNSWCTQLVDKVSDAPGDTWKPSRGVSTICSEKWRKYNEGWQNRTLKTPYCPDFKTQVLPFSLTSNR